MKPNISIIIPSYDMNGLGGTFLDFSLKKIFNQTYQDYEVVVSDHSKHEQSDVENVCRYWTKKKSMRLKYIRNEFKRGSSSANTNAGIKNATGNIVKILFQDDFFFKDTSLEDTAKAFENSNGHWLISACEHTADGQTFFRPFYPRYHDNIQYGENTISSPSVLSFRNKNNEFFDENLIWLMDVEYYKRLHDKFGDPIILNTITVANRGGSHQITNTIVSDSIKRSEFMYVSKLYRI